MSREGTTAIRMSSTYEQGRGNDLGDLKMEATEALRGLISEVRMVPNEEAPNGHHIELAGELAGILALGEAETTQPAQFAQAESATMVAGARPQK